MFSFNSLVLQPVKINGKAVFRVIAFAFLFISFDRFRESINLYLCRVKTITEN